jgi:hypothetical protein
MDLPDFPQPQIGMDAASVEDLSGHVHTWTHRHAADILRLFRLFKSVILARCASESASGAKAPPGQLNWNFYGWGVGHS